MERPSPLPRPFRKIPISFIVRSRRPPGADLDPYMQILTVIILSISLLSWRNKTWNHRILDLNASFFCLMLHYMKQPLLALAVAIVYIVCTTLPGSWASLNLPEYSEFKQKLELLPPNEKEEEEDCMICYDTTHPLALLPCAHKTCTNCLDLMASLYQTTCPACRQPLFSASDEIIYALTRGSVASMIANTTLLLFIGIQNIRESDWMGLAVRIGSQCALAPFLWFYGNLMWEFGDQWWRQIFSSARMDVWDLRWAGAALASGGFASWAILWSSRGTFS